jgi:hypothetical protein
VIHLEQVEESSSDEESTAKESPEEALTKLDILSGDPFPEDPFLRDKETTQCTVRSIATGTLLGIIFGTANLYIGWKTGFGLDAGPVAVFVGYGLLKLCQNKLPLSFGGGFFGPKENVTCQSAANGANSAMGLYAAAYHPCFSP